MVLINELTVEQINAALLHLQRSKDEVVGGNKGTTIQNISISNSGGGGGNNVDYSGAIQNLANNIEKNSESIEGVKFDVHNLEETIRNLSDAGISDLSYDNLSHQLTITTENGDTFQAQIIQDIATLSFDPATNELSITTGEQTQTITLPAQVQSDWTQTDSTEPDFIKNKIPIWITSGSADDNMSPISVVEAGNTRPVTSGGVASALNDYDKATEWTGTLISICPTVGAGQEKTYTINSTTISDLPVQIRGIVTTRVNSLNNRAIQLYYCNQSNNNDIYYRYIEWNGSAWFVGVSWVKLTTTADIVDSVTANNMQSVTSNAVAQALSVIGSTVNGVITTGTYTGTGSFKNDTIGYVDLTKGKWIIILQIEYNAGGASSDSVVGLSLGNENWRVRVPNSNQNNDLNLQLTAFVNVTTSTNRVSLYLYHHKTVTIKGQTLCLAIRIA